MKLYKIALICDKQHYLGFRLSSFTEIFSVNTINECVLLLCELLSTNQYGIIFVLEHLFPDEGIKSKYLRLTSFPFIIKIPIYSKKEINPEDEVLSIIRQSIGYSIKI